MEKQKFVTVDGQTFDAAEVLKHSSSDAWVKAATKQSVDTKSDTLNFANWGDQQAAKLAEVYEAAQATQPAKTAEKAPAKPSAN